MLRRCYGREIFRSTRRTPAKNRLAALLAPHDLHGHDLYDGPHDKHGAPGAALRRPHGLADLRLGRADRGGQRAKLPPTSARRCEEQPGNVAASTLVVAGHDDGHAGGNPAQQAAPRPSPLLRAAGCRSAPGPHGGGPGCRSTFPRPVPTGNGGLASFAFWNGETACKTGAPFHATALGRCPGPWNGSGLKSRYRGSTRWPIIQALL